MLTYINKKRSEKGFTLVELMVVLLIIGILIAVAIPVFLGARARAQDNAVRQTLTNAARALGPEFATNNAWPADAAAAEAIEPSIDFAATAAAGSPPVIGYSVSGGVLTLTGISQSGTTFTITGAANGTLGQIQ